MNFTFDVHLILLLFKLFQALSRSRTLPCSHCGERGASVGCCHNNCPANFHFNCATKAKADFKADKTVYCLKHAQKYAHKQNNAAFPVRRQVFIDRVGEDGRRRCKEVAAGRLQFSLGGLRVEDLGVVLEASDTKKVSNIVNKMCLRPPTFGERKKHLKEKIFVFFS